MKDFFTSKLFLTIEHAAKVAVFLALSTFFTELMNHDIATLVVHYLPVFVTVGTVNLLLVGIVKYFNLKKAAALEELTEPSKEMK